jgi:hypothetical protein
MKKQVNEIEVFRLIPQTGHYYETAEATRRTGNWDSLKYYTTNPLRYMGKFLYHRREGYHDVSQTWAYFEDDDGNIINIKYSYEGNTCFREVEIGEVEIGEV